jgi:hypothetical protein
MITIRLSTDVPTDRNLVLSLPAEVPPGPAEVMLTVEPCDADRERKQADARSRFLTLARSSKFCSSSPYPSRAELHERD